MVSLNKLLCMFSLSGTILSVRVLSITHPSRWYSFRSDSPVCLPETTKVFCHRENIRIYTVHLANVLILQLKAIFLAPKNEATLTTITIKQYWNTVLKFEISGCSRNTKSDFTFQALQISLYNENLAVYYWPFQGTTRLSHFNYNATTYCQTPVKYF